MSESPYQGFSERNDRLDSLIRYDPEPFRKRIVEGGAEAFAEGLTEALKPSIPCGLCKRPRYQVWAYRTFAKVAKLTNSEPTLLVAVLGKFGVRDESELHALVDSGRRMQQLASSDLDLAKLRDDCLEGLRLVLQREPQWRNGVLAQLGSQAVEVNGNGHEA